MEDDPCSSPQDAERAGRGEPGTGRAGAGAGRVGHVDRLPVCKEADHSHRAAVSCNGIERRNRAVHKAAGKIGRERNRDNDVSGKPDKDCGQAAVISVRLWT